MISLRSLALGVFAFAAMVHAEPNCVDNQECLIDLPGTQCADGTMSYMTLTKRPGAKNTLIYLDGGGACWDKESCENGYATTLTRDPMPQDWNNGPGIQNLQDANNPFDKNYNVVYVPYCTADAYTGNRVADYGTPGQPLKINHHGYENVQKVLEKVKDLYPTPDKVVMLGCSAGGIGAYFHMRDLAATFPNTKKYVVSDAGVPFSPPFVDAQKYEKIMKSWGADQHLFMNPHTGKMITSFAELIQYNTQQFGDIRFGFIDGYHDKIMTFFGWAIGALQPLQVVRDVLINTAEKAIGPNAPNGKVFYTETDTHCHTPQPPGSLKSGNTTLATWLKNLIDDSPAWKNERPDLDHYIPPVDPDAGSLPGGGGNGTHPPADWK